MNGGLGDPYFTLTLSSISEYELNHITEIHSIYLQVDENEMAFYRIKRNHLSLVTLQKNHHIFRKYIHKKMKSLCELFEQYECDVDSRKRWKVFHIFLEQNIETFI